LLIEETLKKKTYYLRNLEFTDSFTAAAAMNSAAELAAASAAVSEAATEAATAADSATEWCVKQPCCLKFRTTLVSECVLATEHFPLAGETKIQTQQQQQQQQQ
jgi:hypothetical protein